MRAHGNDEPADQSPATGAQRWLARLSFLLMALAVTILAVFAGLKSVAMLAVGLGAAAVTLAAAFLFLFQARRATLGRAGRFCRRAGRRHHRLRVRRSAVGGDRIGRCVDACRRHSTICASWRPDCLADAGT